MTRGGVMDEPLQVVFFLGKKKANSGHGQGDRMLLPKVRQYRGHLSESLSTRLDMSTAPTRCQNETGSI
jgi:hypothetical protein